MSAKTEPPTSTLKPTSPVLTNDIRQHPLRLRLYPDKALRGVARHVEACDHHVDVLAGDMLELMQRHKGIGLAAPQVGLRLRLIVADIGEGPLAVVNPIVVPVGLDSDVMAEGCLSLPGVELDIQRLLRIELHGAEPSGKAVHIELKGLMARVVQHEVDHLDGILICDYPPPVPDLIREMKGSQ
jgi:peptide deformylase